jgi:hypothetical protein
MGVFLFFDVFSSFWSSSSNLNATVNCNLGVVESIKTPKEKKEKMSYRTAPADKLLLEHCKSRHRMGTLSFFPFVLVWLHP